MICRAVKAKHIRGFFLTSLAIMATNEACAQSTKKASRLLEEVVVTATRKEQNAQDVAISMTVFNQDQIDNANMTLSDDIATYTPSLTTNSAFGKETASFSIRGFTQAPRTAASVGAYFAEVVAPRGQGATLPTGDGAGPGELFDLQSVEVLKGAQGTLFGRNTTGGAVLIVPNRPQEEFDGYLQFSAGNLDMKRIEAVVNLPVSDRLRIRIGMDDHSRDGHLSNVTGIGADDFGDVNYRAGRISATLDLTDSLENYTIFSTLRSETHGYPGQLFACNPNLNPNENPLYAFVGPACEMQLERQRAAGHNGFYDLASTIGTPATIIHQDRLINHTTWNLTDEVSIKNIFSFAKLETDNSADIFGTQFTELQAALLGFGIPGIADPRREFILGNSVSSPGVPFTSTKILVEELRLQGAAFDDRMQWQSGIYYESTKPDGPSGNNAAIVISCDPASLEGDPSEYNCFDPLNGLIGGGVSNISTKTSFVNKAIYAQASHDFSNGLSLTLGARYTQDRTEGSFHGTRHTFIAQLPTGSTVATNSATVETEAPTGVVEAAYHLTESGMLYAKWTRGYRQGGVVAAAEPELGTFDAETVDTHEFGGKFEFGGPVPGRFNFAVFDNDLRDMQLSSGYVSPTFGPTSVIFNAGQARIRGYELESTLSLSENLLLTVSYSRLDTKLLEQEDRRADVEAAGGLIAGATYAPLAEEGDSLPYAPESAGVATLAYSLPLDSRFGELDVSATYVYSGATRSAATSASPWSVMDSYSFWNLSANWRSVLGSSFDLSLFCTNVNDEEYVTAITGSYNSAGLESRQVGQPRMYGARLKYRLGDS